MGWQDIKGAWNNFMQSPEAMGGPTSILDYGASQLANKFNNTSGSNQNNNWYDNADARGYRNYNYYDSAQPFNENLTDENYGKSFAGGQRFDVNKLMNRRLPSNLTRDMGASTYRTPPVYEGQRNIHEGFGTADVSSSFPPPEKTGIMQNIKNWGGNILDNTIMGRIAGGFDATNKRAFNYNPALQDQINFLKTSPRVAGATLSYGADGSGLNKIQGGMLAGKNLQSMLGSNDLIDMYNKQIARHDKTITGFADQWSNLKGGTPEEQAEYARKLAVHQKRKDWALAERDAVIAGTTGGTTGGGVEGGQTAGMRDQLGRAENFRDRSNIQQIQQHTGRELSDYRMDRPASERQFTGQAPRGTTTFDTKSGMGRRDYDAGGRAGFRNGEFVDEDINVQGPGFDFNENIEMAGGEDPMLIEEYQKYLFEMQELDLEPMSFEQFKAEAMMAEGESDQGIASLV